jgi:hypothetical protein
VQGVELEELDAGVEVARGVGAAGGAAAVVARGGARGAVAARGGFGEAVRRDVEVGGAGGGEVVF